MSDDKNFVPELVSVEPTTGRWAGWIVTFKIKRDPSEVSITIPVLVGSDVDDAEIVTTARKYVANSVAAIQAGTSSWLG